VTGVIHAAGVSPSQASPKQILAVDVYGTAVVHFGVVLFLSVIASAPWNGIAAVSVLWGSVGLCGVAYTVVVAWRMRMQRAYRPVFEDWLFHVLLPFVAYAALVVSAYAAHYHEWSVPFLVGTAALPLLFIGIHNAWDVVTYHVFVRLKEERTCR
jgi:hypothetical protein